MLLPRFLPLSLDPVNLPDLIVLRRLGISSYEFGRQFYVLSLLCSIFGGVSNVLLRDVATPLTIFLRKQILTGLCLVEPQCRVVSGSFYFGFLFQLIKQVASLLPMRGVTTLFIV